MDTSDVNLIRDAKRQLRYTNLITILAVVSYVGAWALELAIPAQRELAQTIRSVALFSGFLANSDVLQSALVITRKQLIDALEAQLNRDPAALGLRGALADKSLV